MAAPLLPDTKRQAATIIRHYQSEAGPVVARAFAAALRRAVSHIADHPESGSLRYSTVTGIDGLRFWPLSGFPYVMFYRVDAGTPVVLAILHTSRDIPAGLRP